MANEYKKFLKIWGVILATLFIVITAAASAGYRFKQDEVFLGVVSIIVGMGAAVIGIRTAIHLHERE